MWKIGLSVLEKNEFLEHSTLLRFVRQYYLHTSPVEPVNGRNQFTPGSVRDPLILLIH